MSKCLPVFTFSLFYLIVANQFCWNNYHYHKKYRIIGDWIDECSLGNMGLAASKFDIIWWFLNYTLPQTWDNLFIILSKNDLWIHVKYTVGEKIFIILGQFTPSPLKKRFFCGLIQYECVNCLKMLDI